MAFQIGNKIGKVRIDELLRRKQKGNNRMWLALSLSLSLSLSSFYLGLNLSFFFFYFTRFLLCSSFYIVTLHVTKRNLVLSAKFVYFNSTKERKKERKKISCYSFHNWDIVYFLFWYLIVILSNNYVNQIDVCEYTYWNGKK